MTELLHSRLIEKVRNQETEIEATRVAFDTFKRAHQREFKFLDASLAAARQSPELLGKIHSKYSEIQEISYRLENGSLSQIEVQELQEELIHKLNSKLANPTS